MPDSLTVGSERLVAGMRNARIISQAVLLMSDGTLSDPTPLAVEHVAADPGVKAKHAFVLHFAENDCYCKLMAELGPAVKCYSCIARAALKTWEQGDV